MTIYSSLVGVAKSALAKRGYALRRIEDGFSFMRVGPQHDAYLAQQQLTTVSNPVIFDVGAYDGSMSLSYRSRFPNADIFAFEPAPTSFGLLQAATAADPGIHAFNVALSDQDGISELHVNHLAAANSLLPTDGRVSDIWGDGQYGASCFASEDTLAVETTTLDTFCAKNLVDRIDILKLDVQGAEFRVLNGAKALLSKQAVRLIYLELLTAPTYVGQANSIDIMHLLQAAGYSLFNMYSFAHRNQGRLVQYDAIFLAPTE